MVQCVYMKNMYLECGKVCSAHGVHGLFKTEVWCDSPKVLAAQKRVFLAGKDGYTERKITSATPAGHMVILGIEGVGSREAAVALGGTVLYLKREDIPLPPGRYFIADMIGVPVIDADTGRVYGHVRSVDDAARGRLFTVRTESGDVLIPDVPVFIRRADPDEGLFITPIPGFFDEA